MFLAFVFIILGLFMLLNALGIITGNFWGLFWAMVFLAVGFKLMAKRGRCLWCERLHASCNCGCHCQEEDSSKEEN